MENYTPTKEEFNKEEFEIARIELLKEQEAMKSKQSFNSSFLKKVSFLKIFPGFFFAMFALLMIGNLSKNDTIAAICGLSSILFFFIAFGGIILGAVLIVINMVKDQKPISEMSAYYKEHVVSELIRRAFPCCKYEPEYDLKTDEKYKVIVNDTAYTTQPTEDHIYGTYRGVEFEQTDVYIDRYEVKEDEAATVHGSVFYMKLPKTVQGDVVLIGKRFTNGEAPTRLEVVKRTPMNGSEAIAKLAKPVSQYYGLPRVHMENMWFEEHFFTYAENPEEAFYILTPPFMEQIQRLYGKYQLRIRIHGNEMFLMKEHASFEFDPYKAFDVDIEMEKMRDDMLDLYRVIDCLI